MFPSQFWKHKNHQYIINASKIFKQKKLKLNLSFVEKLMIIETKIILNQLIMKLKKNNLENYVKNLGEVSYKN